MRLPISGGSSATRRSTLLIVRTGSNTACVSEPTPQELLERMELFCHLCVALNFLPEAQGRRVDACVILSKSYREVAEAEGVNESSVRESVKLGLENMKKYLKKVL